MSFPVLKGLVVVTIIDPFNVMHWLLTAIFTLFWQKAVECSCSS